MLAFAVIFLVWSASYGERERQVPMLIGWSMVILCALDVIAATETRIGHAVKAFFAGTIVGESASDAAQPVVKTLVAMAWPIAFVGLVVVFGFVAVIPFYVFLFVVIQGRKSIRLGVIAAACSTAFIYVVFGVLLRYEVYAGLVFGG
jgi:hypothetical protein